MNKKVYEKNLKAYKERYGIDYEPIENNKYENKLEDTKDGNKTLQIENNGKKLYLHSKYNPIKEAEKYYNDFKMRYGTVVFSFGFGLSYYISELLKHINIIDKVFIYEPNKEIFDIAMKNVDISHILENKSVYITFDEKEAKESLLAQSLDKKLDINPIYEQLYKSELVEYMKNIKIGIESDNVDINTIENFKEDWSKAVFAHINSILKSYDISYFEDIFKDKPVVIVGAGPSLNKNVHLLKEIEGKVCIICAFSAARVLKNNNIIPDFLISVDSKQYGLEEYESSIPLIYTKEVNKDLLKNHKSKKIIYISQTEVFLRDILEKNDEVPIVSVGGTVSSFSAGIAYYFGASEIILLGQDFSWTEDKAHADGTVHKREEHYKIYHGKQIEEKDIYGNTVYTNRAFYDFKVWFDKFSKNILPNTKVIQATEGGLPIENAETLTFRQAIDKYCKDKYYNVNEILNNKYESSKLIEEETDKEKVFEKIKIFYKETKDMKKIAKEALQLSKKITNNIKTSPNDLSKNNKAIKRLDKIDVKLKENKNIKQFIELFSTSLNSYYMIEETDDEKLNFAIMNEKLYYNIYTILYDLVEIIENEMNYEKEE